MAVAEGWSAAMARTSWTHYGRVNPTHSGGARLNTTVRRPGGCTVELVEKLWVSRQGGAVVPKSTRASRQTTIQPPTPTSHPIHLPPRRNITVCGGARGSNLMVSAMQSPPIVNITTAMSSSQEYTSIRPPRSTRRGSGSAVNLTPLVRIKNAPSMSANGNQETIRPSQVAGVCVEPLLCCEAMTESYNDSAPSNPRRLRATLGRQT